MTWIDIVLAVPMVWLMLRGWKHGVVREVATLAGVVLGVWASVHLSQWVAELTGIEGAWGVVTAFFICFVGALVLTFLLGRVVEGMLKAVKMGMANRIAGAALGLVKALCVLSVLLSNVVTLDRREVVLTQEVKEKSVLYGPVCATGDWLMTSLKEYISEHQDEWASAITEEREEVEK